MTGRRSAREENGTLSHAIDQSSLINGAISLNRATALLKKLGYSFSLCYGSINETLISSSSDETVSEKTPDKTVPWTLITAASVRAMDRGAT